MNILVPVEYDLYASVVDFYRTTVRLSTHSTGVSVQGNPWHSFLIRGISMTIHTGRDREFPYPEFRPTGHGIALAIEVQSVDQEVKRLELLGVTPRNRLNYADGMKAVSIIDPAGNVLEIWGYS
ncbi:VOC family protein [Paraburkholderia acidicola]|uniref:VOC family protein n=1 Tax=Paraburkholderia acidicola TaxID=1912599 RepID=UPI001A9566A7|nr:VOC family protein [Paraburkholderia acidicola]